MTTVIVPIGGTEQNGPHIALGKHNVRVQALSKKIALTLGDALVAPVLAYVPEGRLQPPTAHMRFPGRPPCRAKRLRRSLSTRRGASSFTAFGTSFSGRPRGLPGERKAVADRLNREWAATPVRVQAVRNTIGSPRPNTCRRSSTGAIGTRKSARTPGSPIRRSLLAVDPRQVRMDRLRSGASPGAPMAYGDPRRSSAELGQLGVDAVVARTVEAIRKAVTRR